MQIEKSILKKSFVAVLFASGMLNSSLLAFSDVETVSSESVVKGIAGNTAYDAKARAYYLFRFASRLADVTDEKAVVNQFRFLTKDASKYYGWESGLETWTRQICYANHETDANVGKFFRPFTPAENVILATTSAREAIKLLESASDEFVKLNLYFVASGLFRKLGENKDAEKCKTIVENAVRACESDQKSGDGKIRAVSSMLNSEAYGFISVQVSEVNPSVTSAGVPKGRYYDFWSPPVEAEIYEEKDFHDSENLKRRAILLADRLPKTDDLRRKAHRDMALWYL